MSPWDSAFGEDAFGEDDETPPTVIDVVPTPGSTVGSGADVVFSVEDEAGLDSVRIEVYQGSWRVAFEEGSFMPDFRSGSVVTATDDGFDFVLRRLGGWVSSPVRVRVTARDTEGNEAS